MSSIILRLALIVAFSGSVLMVLHMDNENKEDLRVSILEEFNERLDSEEENVSLVTIKENELYKAVRNGISYEIYLDKNNKVENIVEVGKELK